MEGRPVRERMNVSLCPARLTFAMPVNEPVALISTVPRRPDEQAREVEIETVLRPMAGASADASQVVAPDR